MDGNGVKVLLACGVVYSVSYVALNDAVAATLSHGYNRMDQAVSELSASGASTRPFLMAMLPFWTALMIAFGIGVWLAAERRHALRVTGGLLVAFGITGVLWLPFPMSSRQEMVRTGTGGNDVGHIVLTVVTIALILLQIGFGAAAFGRRFRIYSVVTAAVVLVFGGLTGALSSRLSQGKPTPWMGLDERISIGAWLLWIAVLAIVLLRAEGRSSSKDEPSGTRRELVSTT